MIANVRRRATSSASGERGGDSAMAAMSDMRLERLAGKTGWIKRQKSPLDIGIYPADSSLRANPYRNNSTAQ
jgi:hypothetical protein